MKHSSGGILQSSRIEDSLLAVSAAVLGGDPMVETKQNARGEELQREVYWRLGWDDLGWDDLEDGLTTSRRAVFAPTLYAEELASARDAAVQESEPLRRAVTA